MIVESYMENKSFSLDTHSVILVTGAAGFIGSNFVRYLNNFGYSNVIAVDDLTDSSKFRNLSGSQFSYLDKTYLANMMNQTPSGFGETLKHLRVKAIFHFGGISSTTHTNGQELMDANYGLTLGLLVGAAAAGIPVHYSSSSSVYGNEPLLSGRENPLNCYAFSKLQVDNMVKRYPTTYGDYLGCRYTNVYGGMGEAHKLGQASPIFTFAKQALETKKITLFVDENNPPAKRDFVHVSDICDMHWYCFTRGVSKQIMDFGSGEQHTFEDVANIVSSLTGATIEKLPFPKKLLAQYQRNTLAHRHHLSSVGYVQSPVKLESGIESTVRAMKDSGLYGV